MSAPDILRPYQTASLEAMADALAFGQRRLLVKMPTGVGKTTVFSELPKHDRVGAFLGERQRGAFMLVIAHLSLIHI